MTKNLHGWYFTYNYYTDKWSAAKSENKEQLASGDKGGVLRSSSIHTLIELVYKTNGDKNKINKLLKK